MPDADEETSDNSDEGFVAKDGGIDAKYHGFCRTNPVYRAHYRIARFREKEYLQQHPGLREEELDNSTEECERIMSPEGTVESKGKDL